MREASKREIYLDNSATTKVYPEVADVVREMMLCKYGNPSSLHGKGLEAEDEIDKARRAIATQLGCDPGELYFTSGGTEANNLAILGAAKSIKKSGAQIVTTAIEHSSVLEPMRELEKQGFVVEYLMPDKYGVVHTEAILNAINAGTVLVSVMMVNNELGSRQPIESIKKAIKAKRSAAVLHVDAVQAFTKVPVKVNQIKADLLTVTAHKVHGPKGVGALYISKDAKVKPILFGGEQQRKVRPGTESAALIPGFGEAVTHGPCTEKVSRLCAYCIESLRSIKEVVLNSPPDAVSIVNFSVPGIRSEIMLHFLSSRGIFVSSGSACAKGQASHVLRSLGIDDALIDSAIRVSFSRFNTMNDIDELIKAVNDAIKNIKKVKG